MAFFKFRQGDSSDPSPRADAAEPARAPKGQGRPRKSRADASAAAPLNPLETVEVLRRRARHRLIGAAVLVLAAVIGFPLLFDSEPRPLVVHAPIVIPDRNDVAPLRLPGTGQQDAGAEVSTSASLDAREEVVAPDASNARGRVEVVKPDPAVLQAERARHEKAQQEARRQVEAEAREKARIEAEERARRQAEAQARARQQGEQESARKQAAEKQAAEKAAADKLAAEKLAAQKSAAEKAAAEKAAAEKAAAEKLAAEKLAAEKAATEDRARREAERARAALEGRGAAKPTAAGGAFVVQIGAFAQDDAVRQVRQKTEGAGLKTHTQVVDTAQGKRTRVRLGPYATRAEAEQALVKLKLVGLDGNVQAQ